ncbi:MAG: hypothetical protein JKY63_00680 [Rhodobiaceae bacterium]|nr:hypothetical protein [Rhodobiaceae bacterium]
MNIVDADELNGLPTKALLARLKRLRWCEENRAISDLSDAEVRSLEGKIVFKDTEIWRAAYRDIKAVLATREHISSN